ncbi:MAG: hypothetical protein JSS30_02405 [Verrucomicrobia bacterium]|nr:hypothetical protein [Verrucomicrobiota bacterium]
MKKTLILLTLASVLVHAEDCCMPEYTPDEPIYDGCAGYSQYAGVQLNCGWDLYAFGEFLYWRPFRSATYVTVSLPPNPFNAPSAPQFMHSPTLGFRPAFRVGIGMIAHCFDDWAFNADYTWYHHNFSKTYSEDFPGSITSTIVFLPQFQFLYNFIRSKISYHYDVVGINVQRANYLGQRVILSPFLGLKWLRRSATSSQELTGFTGLTDRATSTLKYTSIGVDAGFDGYWLMCWGFSLIGKADVALLYAYQRSATFRATPAAVSLASPVTSQKMHIRHLDIFAKGGLGIGWGSYFCQNRYHTNFSVTYDFMGDVSKLDFLNGPMFGNGAVVLMGLTVRGQFDF